MTILANDIKLMKADTMSDVAEGGGAMTGQPILDGVSNNMFDDVSTLDRVYGAVHLRKAFGAVQTANQDKYYGAHAIISKLPGDQKIGVNLFNTGDWFDRRPVAASRIENYRAQGPIYAGFLWGTQYMGSRAVTIFQGVTAPLPGIGDVLLLVASGGSQYIRIVDLEYSDQQFTDDKGTFTRRIIEIEISDVLQRDFVGAEMSRFDTLSPAAKIYKTVVANAARYYSARPLALAANLNAVEIKVDSVYSQVVPASQAERALVDVESASIAAPVMDAAQTTTSFSTGITFQANSTLYLGSPCVPGSLVISGGASLTDNAGKVLSGSTVVGSIDYAEGLITFAPTSPTYGSTKTVVFRPAAAPAMPADTDAIPVTAANRGYVWALTLTPAPKPGALRVSYRAMDKWYELRDNGSGGLIADEAGIGTGTVNYVTGGVSITTAALPDVGSEIMFAWGQAADYFNRSNLAIGKVTFTHQLGNMGFAPETLVITWNDGSACTATVNASGVISGDATGNVNLVTGVVSFSPNSLPLGGTTFTFNYNWGTPITKTLTAFNISGNQVTLDVADTDLVPGSISVAWNAPWAADPIKLSPTPSGSIKQEDRDNGVGGLIGGRSATIDYATGILVFNHNTSGIYKGAMYTKGSNPYKAGHYSAIYDYGYYSANTTAPSEFVVTYRKTSPGTAAQETLVASALQIDLTPGYAENVIPGSVLFTLGGRTYFDRLGQLFYNIDRATGSATLGGTLDYTTGVCSISAWASGQSPTPSLLALATSMNWRPVEVAVFRTLAAPIKVGVFQIRATAADGTQLEATANAQGDIVASQIEGKIEYDTGVVKLRFGELVTAAGNEGEDWYIAENVENGQIWKPKMVLANSIIYTTVSYTYLPLSSAILGLDPVRLPADGRVPIYAPGDVVVVLNDQTTTGTFTSSSTTNLGRVRLAKLTVRDLGGNALPTNKYTADLDAGTITWGDLSGVSQPLTIIDRIEDMAVLTDVQITGQLALSQPLSHNFPKEGTLVSNAIIWGTLYARTSIPFDQQTWTNVWSDTLIGSSVAAQYNNVQYPIAVDNASAIQEKWAIIFTSSTAFNVIGQNVGQIASGNTSADTAPINPNTGLPYFTIPYQGWGSGWASGNVLRFNTYAANAPVWVIQAIGQGEATDDDYTFCLEIRGDIGTV
ncbi:hypothetical protein [Methylomonas rapida]|uniref:Tail protein n=1 Tax=Methylomonas rapida TaxID=2963939 RepID=A0ABY7GFD9_9GAMM|nr:hypothetical protein [Methylomonas rapida]WAR42941.1 hypothetical protein NM686_011055 [Methylomonas rapida]